MTFARRKYVDNDKYNSYFSGAFIKWIARMIHKGKLGY